MQLATYREMKDAIPRSIKQGAVAEAMGFDPGAFSHGLAFDPAGAPSASFIARFEDALERCTSGVPTA